MFLLAFLVLPFPMPVAQGIEGLDSFPTLSTIGFSVFSPLMVVLLYHPPPPPLVVVPLARAPSLLPLN